MKQLLEAIKAKYLCLHDWEVLHKTEYVTYWEILLKCKKCGKLRKKRVSDTLLFLSQSINSKKSYLS